MIVSPQPVTYQEMQPTRLWTELQEGENFPLFEVFHILHSWQQQLQQSGTQEVSEGPNLKSLYGE